jgi:hypothetical protein
MYQAQIMKKEFQKSHLEGVNYCDQFEKQKNAWKDGDNYGMRFDDGSVLLSNTYSGCISAYLELD